VDIAQTFAEECEVQLSKWHISVVPSDYAFLRISQSHWSWFRELDRQGRPVTTYDGRLELTWTNKHLRLLAHEDGSYEWVPPSDYRVAEVRLLQDVTKVGDVGQVRSGDNLLIRGDSLNALTSLSRLPEFASEYLGKVKLVYIDPPFNTQQSFLQYDDALEHSVWLTMIRDRLRQIKPLLSEDGSVWVHLDDTEVHRCRVVLDEEFGPSNFVGTVVWEKVYTPDNRSSISPTQDYILVYAVNPSMFKESRNLLSRGAAQDDAYSNPDSDPRGPWKAGDFSVQAGHATASQFYELETPSGNRFQPPKGRAWVYTEDRYRELLADNRVYFGKNGEARPSVKRFLSETRQGVTPDSWWPYSEVGHSQEAKKEIKALFPDHEPFATPKPERLISRIIHIATKPGDIVLDCFAGSGTTGAVAHKMGRRWLLVEQEAETIETFTLPRLRMVVEGNDPGGITSREVYVLDELPEGVKPGESRAAAKTIGILQKSGALDEVAGEDGNGLKELLKALRLIDKTKTETVWRGGGGFRVLEVSQSMFETDGGLVFLADWMTNGTLAEATAAQLGFTYESDPPFAGRKGRTRLVVVDGVVNESVVRLVVSALPDRERVVVCGTGIDTDARPILRELRPGSTLRKIPAALLDEYRSARQLRLGFEIPDKSETSRVVTVHAEVEI
jgi:adenine-specific DNA-methyltransferase